MYAKKTMLVMAGMTVGAASMLTATPAGAEEAPAATGTQSPPTGTTRSAQPDPDAIPARCDGASRFFTKKGRSTFVPTQGNNTGNILCELSRGDKDMNGVYKLQLSLNTCYGLDTGGLDANFGAKTEAAVNQVREFKSMPQNGVYDSALGKQMIWPIFVPDGQGGWKPTNECDGLA